MVYRKTTMTALLCVSLTMLITPVVQAEPGFFEWVGEKIAGPKIPQNKKNDKKPDAVPASVPVQREEVYRGIAPPRDGRAWIQMATSPDHGSVELIITTINSASSSIKVAAHVINNHRIVDALMEKHKRGVSVMIVIDRSQTSGLLSATKISNAGIPIRVISKYEFQKSNFILIDSETVQTGSFSYTEAAASKNSEDVLVVWNHKGLAGKYMDYWLSLWGDAGPLKRE